MAGIYGVGAAAVGFAPDVVDLLDNDGEAVPPQEAAASARLPMRWNNNSSGFVLRRMTAIVIDGRAETCFKDKDDNKVAKCLNEYTGEAVTPTQVYNHLRKWRQKWGKMARLKGLRGALWDSTVNAIMLYIEHYTVHCKVAKLELNSHLNP
jgi:hypothetical protein